MPEPGKVLNLPGWPRGLNKTVHPALLEPDELFEAVNVTLGPGGEAIIRKGYQPYLMDGEVHLGTGVDYHWIKALPTVDAFPTFPENILAFRTDGTMDLIPHANQIGSASVLSLDLPGHRPQVVTMNDKYYVAPSVAAGNTYEVAVTAGPTVTVNSKTRWTGSTDQANQFPAAKSLLVAYDRVFAGGISNSATQRPRLFFSDQLLPLSWKAANFIDVAPDDGQNIIALQFFADQILIFKEHSVWGLAGSDFVGLGNTLYKVEGSIGTVARDSIVSTGNALIFLDPSRGIYLYDGSVFHDIGKSIFQYMRENWNAGKVGGRLRQSTGWLHDNKYHLSVPWDADGTPSRTFVYDLLLGAWTEHHYGVRAVAKRHVTEDDEVDSAGVLERILAVGVVTLEGSA